MVSKQQTVLITGCSDGGIGSGLARALASRGFHVFAGVRTPSKASDLASLPNVTVLTLDVTIRDAIDQAVRAVRQHTGDGGLNILINNAGHGYPCPLVDADLAAARALYEVNVWGVLAMVQAFTPLLVEAKGSIVNISSVGSFVHTPYIGIYDSSKAAVTMLSETLRIELAPFGVKVLTAMVGLTRTRFGENLRPAVLPENSMYKRVEKEVNSTPAQGESLDNRSMDVDEFSKRLVGDILAGKTGPVYRGSMSTTVRLVRDWLPLWVLDRVVSSYTGLTKKSNVP